MNRAPIASRWLPADGMDAAVRDRSIARRSRLYTVMTVFLVTVMGLAVADGLDVVDVFGVDTSWKRASGGGYELAVRYGTVSRPALATPFDIEVTRAAGFTDIDTVTVAVTREYLSIWDENGLSPAPSSESVHGEWRVWEFDPPLGDTLHVAFDARIEPGAQSGKSGRAAVLVDGEPVVEVSFRTRVMP